MLQHISGFFRRLFGSRAFRVGLSAFLCLCAASFLYNYTAFLRALMNAGMPFRQAVRVMLRTPLIRNSHALPSSSFVLGIIIGLVGYFRKNRKNRKAEEAEETEEPAAAEIKETPAEAPAQEEEFIEPPRFMSR